MRGQEGEGWRCLKFRRTDFPVTEKRYYKLVFKLRYLILEFLQNEYRVFPGVEAAGAWR
jgi:hypothetical protein